MVKADTVLFHVGDFKFRSKYFLVILVLGIAFTCSFIMRSYPAKYGFYLNEADPFFNYRATKYIVDNGLEAYWKWHDNMSWYPEGRDIPKSSQSGLHLITAFFYLLLGRDLITLLDFTIMLPVVLGSLSTIVIFGLVKTITGGNTTAGMFSSLLFAFSPSLIQRGNLGWFKSEPLGLFLGLIALYLFLCALNHKESVSTIIRSAGAGIILGLANASWGGVQYFSIPISLFLITLPFLRKDLRMPVLAAITLTILTLVSAASFPRPGIAFIFGLPGISLIGSTVFLVNAHFLKKLSHYHRQKRNTIFLLATFLIVALGALIGGTYYSSDLRYLNALSPFISPQTSLTEFVAEHAKPTLVDYFVYHSVLLFLAGLGAWVAFKSRKTTIMFALILAITGVYVSAGLVRLMVYASIGIIILAGIALGEMARYFWRTRSSSTPTNLSKSKGQGNANDQSNFEGIFRLSFITIIIAILVLPMIYPRGLNWIELADAPPLIVAAGGGYNISSNDWLDSLNWISKNTPKDAVIAAWWDYGYWITTLGNRTTLADNANINATRTATIAKMFMEQPEKGIKIARDLKADYILIHVVAHRILINGSIFYVLGYGGDESKVSSMIGMSGFEETKYIAGNIFTSEFWTGTLLGSLMPFNRQGYTYFESGEPGHLFKEFIPGTSSVYSKEIKYPVNDTAIGNNPLNLVYWSPSFMKEYDGVGTDNETLSVIFIYKLNDLIGLHGGLAQT
jgi:dolichyl-diphosphooligosaccharide--protein glycosyltransferase